MEGLWYTHFTAGHSRGEGMTVLHDGQILGCDRTHTYTGTYHFDGSQLYAYVHVSPTTEDPDIYEPEVNLFLKGSVAENAAIITGHPDDRNDVDIAVELRRAA